MRYAFVTTEYWPLTDGGAGRLNADLVHMLTSDGHDVHVILVASDHVDNDDARVHVVRPSDDAGWDSGFMAASKAAAEGLAEVHRANPLDRVEIQDFDGLPFWTLTHRRDLGLDEVPITVRFHGPVDLQIDAMGVGTPDLVVAAQMERESFSMADASVVPSEGIRALAIDRYGLEPERVLIGPPVVRSLPAVDGDRSGNARFTVIGRLSEVKGSHDMVEAAIPFLRENSDATVTFVGSDGWSATAGRPMREWLASLIPEDVSDQIVFLDPVGDRELAAILAESTAAVAPSRFESFSLSVHEARQAGAPVVLPSIPAFADLFTGDHGAVMYDGSVQGLSASLSRLAGDRALVENLSQQPAPGVGDPLAVYDALLPPVWHLRSQGGLATAALARVEAVRFPNPKQGRRGRILQSVIRSTPDSLVATMSRLVPGRMRRRIRQLSDWDLEEARQRKEQRWSVVRERIARGELAELSSPHVSIVIPCFNQGVFVGDALLSVFEQTADDYEVVIVDDGSDDGSTPEILDSLRYPRVTVLRQENAGLPGARNRGIEAARGDLVVTLDADDEIAPGYLEELASALEADDDVAFAHCWARIHGDYQAIWATRPFNRYQILLSNSIVGCVMLRKEAWEAVGGYDETMLDGNEDWDLWIRLSEAGYRSAQVTEPLFWYRKHGVSMSVETEARYEFVLSSLSQRLPGTYSLDHLRIVKQAEYPLLCVLTDNDSLGRPFDDSQIIVTQYDSIGSVMDDVRAKYVVWWPLNVVADAGVLADLCSLLEEHDTAGAAETVGSDPIRVVRSWSLRDPDAPQEIVTSASVGSCNRRLAGGQFPDSKWQVPREIGGIEVTRQRPEEAGRIPEWVDQ